MEMFTYQGVIVVSAQYSRIINKETMRTEHGYMFESIYNNAIQVNESVAREFSEFIETNYLDSALLYKNKCIERYRELHKKTWRTRLATLITNITRTIG